jgi:hypothetical protein
MRKKTLNSDRRSYLSKTVLVAQRESGFNLEIELKNIILRRVSIFEFLHNQGHKLTFKNINRVSKTSDQFRGSTRCVREGDGMNRSPKY